MSRPDLPRAIAPLFCASSPVNPQTQNVSIIEVSSAIVADLREHLDSSYALLERDEI